MDFTDVAKQVQKYAPLLGAALAPVTGGASVAVGAGVSGLVTLVGSAFGMTEEQIKSDPGVLAARIGGDPDAQVKLVEIQTQHKTRIEEILLERDKAFLQDRQNARAADVAKTKSTGKRDYNLYILAWTVVTGFFILVGMMYFIPLPERSIGPINQLMGALATGFGMVLSYFFGSSKSSADKTALMSNNLGTRQP